MRRIVKTLDLKPDAELIEKYKYTHDHIWPEIREGIKKAGISNMELYLLDNRAVMIVELDKSLKPEKVFDLLATMPRQQEWEEYVAQFQECREDDTSAEKWKTMTKIFSL